MKKIFYFISGTCTFAFIWMMGLLAGEQSFENRVNDLKKPTDSKGVEVKDHGAFKVFGYKRVQYNKEAGTAIATFLDGETIVYTRKSADVVMSKLSRGNLQRSLREVRTQRRRRRPRKRRSR